MTINYKKVRAVEKSIKKRVSALRRANSDDYNNLIIYRFLRPTVPPPPPRTLIDHNRRDRRRIRFARRTRNVSLGTHSIRRPTAELSAAFVLTRFCATVLFFFYFRIGLTSVLQWCATITTTTCQPEIFTDVGMCISVH